MKLRLSRIFVTFVLVIAGTLASVTPAAAKTLVWSRWDSNIHINSDGTFTVQEIYEIQFIGGGFTYGFRTVPINQFVSLRNVSVHEGGTAYRESSSERANTFYVSDDSESYEIRWYYPATYDETRIFTVEYTVVEGIIIDDEVGDRLFWKAIGPEHAFPIESSTVTVHMPSGAKIDTAIEPASFGVTANYSVTSDLSAVTFQASDIPADQEFEVGVRFPHGYVEGTPPPWQAEYEREQVWNDQWRGPLDLAFAGLGVLVLLVGVFGVYFTWLTAGRDPDSGPVPSYITEPPSDLAPGLVGALVDEKVDLQDIIATLVDLARRGALDIEESDNKVFGFRAGSNFSFHRNVNYSGSLLDYEASLLRAVFGSSEEVTLDNLRNQFYASIPKLEKAFYTASVNAGLFPRNPQSVRSQYLSFGVIGILLTIGLGFCGLPIVIAAIDGPVDTLICPVIAIGLAAFTMLGVSGAMPAKSRKGAEEAKKWKAFKVFLLNAERYKELGTDPSIFDKYLPYAIAFGLERSWIGKFANIANTPVPDWYWPVGSPYRPGFGRVSGIGSSSSGVPMSGSSGKPQGISPGASLDGMSGRAFAGLGSMSSGLFSMLNSTASTFTSVPHSTGSGSSGWSGGGFSSGGFSSGGGGGGGGAGFG